MMPFTHLETTYSLDRVNDKTRPSPFQESHSTPLGQPVRQPNENTVSSLDRYAPMSLYAPEINSQHDKFISLFTFTEDTYRSVLIITRGT